MRMIMNDEVIFPIRVYFENGETQEYESISDLEMNLEDYDSDIDVDCKVVDKLDRPIRLKLRLLQVESICLQTSSSLKKKS
jgi:hypothetical protein